MEADDLDRPVVALDCAIRLWFVTCLLRVKWSVQAPAQSKRNSQVRAAWPNFGPGCRGGSFRGLQLWAQRVARAWRL